MNSDLRNVLKFQSALDKLSPSQKHAFSKVVSFDYDWFLMLGKAGSGKTKTTTEIIEYAQSEGWEVLVSGTTGVAAQQYAQYGASTMAQLFGLGDGSVLPKGLKDSGKSKYDVRMSVNKAYNKSILKTAKARKILLIIDEISMASAEQLVIVHQVIEAHKAFKGSQVEIKVVCVGDVRQLAPVPPRKDAKPWAIHTSYPIQNAVFEPKGHAPVYYQSPLVGYPNQLQESLNTVTNEVEYTPIENVKHKVEISCLLENHRQKGSQKSFVDLINDIGSGEVSSSRPLVRYEYIEQEDGSYVPASKLNVTGEVITHEQASKALHVYFTNRECAAHNQRIKELELLKNPNLKVRTYKADTTVNASFPGGVKEFKSQIFNAIPEYQELYVGASYMVRANVPNTQFKNGTVGTITELSNEGIKLRVEQPDGSIYTEWLLRQDFIVPVNHSTGEAYGKVVHLPGHLASAMTAHKTQGITWEGRVIYHLSKYKPGHGQTYTVITRVTEGTHFLLVADAQNRCQSYCDPFYKEFIRTTEEATMQEMLAESFELGGEIERVEEDWKVIIKVKVADSTYEMVYFLGRLESSKMISGDVSRDMNELELEKVSKVIEDKSVNVTSENKTVLNAMALEPMLVWAEESIKKAVAYVGNDSKKANAVNNRIASLPKAAQLAMCLYGYEMCLIKEVLFPVLEGRNTDLTFDILEVDTNTLPDTDDRLTNIEVYLAGLHMHEDNSQDYIDEEQMANTNTLIGLSHELHAYVSKRNPELLSFWNVEAWDTREGANENARCTVNCTVEGFYVNSVPEVEVEVEGTHAVSTTPLVVKPVEVKAPTVIQVRSTEVNKLEEARAKVKRLADELAQAEAELAELEGTPVNTSSDSVEALYNKGIELQGRMAGHVPSEFLRFHFHQISGAGAMALAFVHGHSSFNELHPTGKFSEQSTKELAHGLYDVVNRAPLSLKEVSDLFTDVNRIQEVLAQLP